MPAIDHCQPAVIRALEKAGWWVVSQPLAVRTDRTRHGYVFMDLLLQQNAVDEDAIVVAEVKCFANAERFLDDFYRAIGQYIVYRNALRLNRLSYPVYLALPWLPYQQRFGNKLVQAVLDDLRMNLVVVDLEQEEIAQWIISEG